MLAVWEEAGRISELPHSAHSSCTTASSSAQHSPDIMWNYAIPEIPSAEDITAGKHMEMGGHPSCLLIFPRHKECYTWLYVAAAKHNVALRCSYRQGGFNCTELFQLHIRRTATWECSLERDEDEDESEDEEEDEQGRMADILLPRTLYLTWS